MSSIGLARCANLPISRLGTPVTIAILFRWIGLCHQVAAGIVCNHAGNRIERLVEENLNGRPKQEKGFVQNGTNCLAMSDAPTIPPTGFLIPVCPITAPAFSKGVTAILYCGAVVPGGRDLLRR